ncbi:MAG: MGMT family protein [Bacillota bacterium]
MLSFTERAITIIKNIPSGKVMTYGQIARLAGSPRGARQVVRILHSMSDKHHLPWHRVINSKGEIGFQDSESFSSQKQFLEVEGIVFCKNHVIDLKRYQFHPVEVEEDLL